MLKYRLKLVKLKISPIPPSPKQTDQYAVVSCNITRYAGNNAGRKLYTGIEPFDTAPASPKITVTE